MGFATLQGADPLAQLCEENALLRARLDAFARDFLGEGLVLPAAWGLTPREKRLVACLLTRSEVSRDGLMAAIYRYETKDEPEPQILGVMVSKIRRKLTPLGITIRNLHGFGFAIDEPARSALRQQCERG